MTELVSALGRCAISTERHIAGAGWDQPTRLFALVPTAQLLAAEPQLAASLGAEEASDGLTAIEQEDLPAADTIEELLAQLAWPEAVVGAALCVERLVVPPEAEQDLPTDPQEALADHPDRADVRLLVAVDREGGSVCLLRQRNHDSDDEVAFGKDIAPGLVAGLLGTFA